MDFFEALWRDFTSLFGERVQLGTNSVTTLNIIVWSLFIGFIIAIGVTLYNKIVLGKIIRALIDKGALTPGSALSADEIGAKTSVLRFALRGKGSLGRVILSVQNDAENGECDCENAKYYIPNENLHRAQVVYGKPEIGVFSVLLAIVAFLIVTLLAFLVIPELMQLFSNIFGMM